MKVRQGFVSNSSSSSFAIVVIEDAHQKAYAGLTDEEREVIDHMMSGPTDFHGLVVRYGIEMSTQDYGTFAYLSEEEGLEDCWSAWGKYQKAIDKKDSLTMREDI